MTFIFPTERRLAYKAQGNMLLIYPCACFSFKDVICGMRFGFNNAAVLLEGNKLFKKRCQFLSIAKMPTQPSPWSTLILYAMGLNLSGDIIPSA